MKVKIDVFSGFLGAGKTTLIKKLINESFYKEKVVVIENEFGEIGIDGSILKTSNIEVKEINAGCICCSIAGDFKKAVKEVIDKYRPVRIIIEPSGVAKLSEILSACSSAELKGLIEVDMVITVIDVLKYDMYIKNFGEFYKNQIMNAKTVVLSRTQKINSDKLLSIKENISSLNNRAFVVTTPWDKLSGQKISELNDKKSVQNEVNLIKRASGSLGLRASAGHKGNDVFQTISFETPKAFSSKLLKNYLDKANENKAYGTILRAKGIVQVENEEWIQFDYVPGEFEMRKTAPDYSGRLCVIGVDLNKENIKRLFSL
ncbi:GTP-binding protein [Clostridium sp. YIM B02515]|uniref:GTP-binding protein n=1 Tax=Clostridium rhizosphaerae TaxID=2803861 RepID=A0ABS1TDT3_9CLOT|nr:GTP-binding protein [Clostridium rhizosphaerae]MBL4937531.1 GTP-binding protein [Clostridium rhizosphaerae]